MPGEMHATLSAMRAADAAARLANEAHANAMRDALVVAVGGDWARNTGGHWDRDYATFLDANRIIAGWDESGWWAEAAFDAPPTSRDGEMWIATKKHADPRSALVALRERARSEYDRRRNLDTRDSLYGIVAALDKMLSREVSDAE